MTISLIPFLAIPLAQAADQTWSQRQFLEAVREENLALKSSEAQVTAKRAGAKAVGLPAPMVGAIFSGHEDAGAGVELSQVVPYPGKLTADRDARDRDAEAQVAAHKALERESLAQAKLLYFQLWQSRERASLLQEKIRAIGQHLKLATAGARSDSYQKIHVLKAESDRDLLENELAQTNQERRERQIAASRLVNRDPSEFKIIASQPELSPLPERSEVASSYQLKLPRLELEREQARERGAKRGWFPDFNIRFRDMPATAMTPHSSELMIGASLPFLFFWDANSSSEQQSAARAAAEFKLGDERRRILAEQEALFTRAESLRGQLALIRDNLIPRAEKRQRLVHNLAPRDLEILQDHRETMEALPDLKLKALELRGQYEATVADLEKYLSENSK